MTSSRQSGPLVASTLTPQSQHEVARRDLVMGLVQAWSARSPGREVYARFLEQSSEHSLTASLTCPASQTKMAVSTTDASHTFHGSLIPGSAWPNPGAAEALVHRSRRLHRLAGYDANVAVACVRGPSAIQ
ncbi:hypothetical protein ASPCAL15040 [Aspergillus calidoustus]|uniref:Uncharacterized protein n=1 Tax=Aspergillus calidoustus TaxID=454130 RepID=A0A0U5CKS4_ASPCI|nr:hypothetical protein ASPCAL15040 [Aspergillus calidoustus]